MPPESYPHGMFSFDRLSWIMATLGVFVIVTVLAFARRYLAGDSNQGKFILRVLALAASVTVMAFADQVGLFFAAWTVSNLLLVALMVHKAKWAAARNAGLLAFKTFSLGFALLGGGLFLLSQGAGTTAISEIVRSASVSETQTASGLTLIAIAAMTQCAAWPFHRWLLSSLNSPTPVSALMHAGLVNGGGFLIVRFAPLYASHATLLQLLFVAGLVTATVGTFWKLLQTDIKRMLACSTMGQLGFMLMQLGMGLFAPAVSHLCWHGLFKAYLFLRAGSTVEEKRTSNTLSIRSPAQLLLACVAGLLGAAAFGLVGGFPFSAADTRCVMIALAFMAATQLAIGMLGQPLNPARLIATPIVAAGAGALYGVSVHLIDAALLPLHIPGPRPMDALYAAGLGLIALVWIAMIANLPARLRSSAAWKRLYVSSLNASQPHPTTVTSNRSSYQF